MKPFKCWFIANFEIFMLLLTAITSSIIFWRGAGIEHETALLVYLYGLFGVFLLTFPTNRSAWQFGKYILMLGGVVFLTWAVKSQGWAMSNLTENNQELTSSFLTYFWIVFSIATVISGWLAYYTYVNIDEVISLRMLWKNSNVSLFEFSWLYTLDRFCNITVSIVVCTLQIIFHCVYL